MCCLRLVCYHCCVLPVSLGASTTPLSSSLQNMSPSRLVWHRRDLRIADNELYHSKQITAICSVYIFDPSDYSTRQTGISDGKGGQLQSLNHGPHFSRRLIDAVHSLRRNLQSLGGDLIIRTGNPLQILFHNWYTNC